MATHKAIPQHVLDVLNAGEIKNDVYFLPRRRFSRDAYVEIAEVIKNAGGKWNKKAKGFLFNGSLAAFREALENGKTVNVQQVTQFFPTPAPLAKKIAVAACLRSGQTILEPSAGQGALVHAAGAAFFGTLYFTLIEKDEANFAELAKKKNAGSGTLFHNAELYHKDFLCCHPTPGTPWANFDRVIMNPPFANGADIKHILHAWEFLKPGGGKLVAICADGPKQNAILRPWAESLEGTWEPLPAGTFKESGTNVNTVMLTANA